MENDSPLEQLVAPLPIPYRNSRLLRTTYRAYRFLSRSRRVSQSGRKKERKKERKEGRKEEREKKNLLSIQCERSQRLPLNVFTNKYPRRENSSQVTHKSSFIFIFRSSPRPRRSLRPIHEDKARSTPLTARLFFAEQTLSFSGRGGGRETKIQQIWKKSSIYIYIHVGFLQRKYLFSSVIKQNQNFYIRDRSTFETQSIKIFGKWRREMFFLPFTG